MCDELMPVMTADEDVGWLTVAFYSNKEDDGRVSCIGGLGLCQTC